MCHIVATCYNLTLPERGICETFFPIRGATPLNLHAHIMWIGLIPNHFIHVYMKEGCPILSSCTKGKNHKIDEVEKQEFAFMHRQALFKDLMSKGPKPLK
jgi:hypothetical protein